MFIVQGLHEGPYNLVVEGPDISGAPRIERLLTLNVGQSFQATPTSEAVVLDLGNEASVLNALRALTSVVTLRGEVPPLEEDADVPADAVY